jgi:hypothetical protein
MKQLVAIAISVICLITSNRVHAWGAEGHQAVCEIAYGELSEPAKRQVDEIMSHETDARFRTFSAACNWPDREGEIQTQRRSDHFINVPRHWGGIWYEACPEATTCLFNAIWKDLSIVARRGAPMDDRLEALKFLGHWVGDIHQPLHVSYKDDRGGNEILVRENLGCKAKLHTVWDTCLPRHLMKKLGANDAADLGRLLQQRISKTERVAWNESLMPLTWAGESYSFARDPDVQYCTLKGMVCWYSAEQREFFEAEELADEGRVSLDLKSSYEERWEALAEKRLKQAGSRLAALLNEALAQ